MFDVAQKKMNDLNITAVLQIKKNENIALENGVTNGQFILSHNRDCQVAAYKITEGYRPTYKGSIYYPDGTPILMSDFYSSTNQECSWYFEWGNHYNRISWWYLKNAPTSSTLYEFNSGWIHESSSTVTKADKTSKNSDWARERDPSLDGKCMSVEDFQNCAWYYIPSFHILMGGECTSHFYHNYGEIDTDHISATYYDVTPDTAVVKSEQADVLIVTFTHNGSKTVKYYPIYLETRNSACTTR